MTVVIPTYGRPRFLEEALASIIAQTHRPIEVVVVDDCSPFAVQVELPADAGVDVVTVRHARNMGPGAARNTGLAHSNGTFVTFLDDDDLLLPSRITEAVTAIGQASMHACRANIPTPRYDGDRRHDLLHGPLPLTGQVIHRRTDVLQFDPTLRVSEDIEWWMRMRDRAIFAWSDEEGVRIRRHDGLRPGVDPQKRLRCRTTVLERHWWTLDRRARAEWTSWAASAAVLAGRRWQGMRLSLRSLASRPTLKGLKLLGRSLLLRSAALRTSGGSADE